MHKYTKLGALGPCARRANRWSLCNSIIPVPAFIFQQCIKSIKFFVDCVHFLSHCVAPFTCRQALPFASFIDYLSFYFFLCHSLYLLLLSCLYYNIFFIFCLLVFCTKFLIFCYINCQYIFFFIHFCFNYWHCINFFYCIHCSEWFIFSCP